MTGSEEVVNWDFEVETTPEIEILIHLLELRIESFERGRMDIIGAFTYPFDHMRLGSRGGNL